MNRTTIAAALLIAGLSLSGSAFGQGAFIDAFVSSGPSDTPPATVGEPFTPPSGDTGETDKSGKKYLRDWKKKPPVGDPSLPGYVAGRQDCADSLGHLRKVRASAIRAAEGAVQVTPVCERRNLIDQQDGVASIRIAVGRNDQMSRALSRSGYVPDDVVGVVLDGRGALLYVHAR